MTTAILLNYQLKYLPAEDTSVDPEWLILRADGRQTDMSIQDCRSYGGGFAVNRHGGEGDDFWVQNFGTRRTLKAAFELCVQKLSEN